jgi:hypothetical protein
VPRDEQDAPAVADACQLERFDVVSFDMSALLVWKTAAISPERPQSLTALWFRTRVLPQT